MPVVSRRAFLKLTAVAASAAAFARLLPGRALAAARACIPVLGVDVPLAVPFAVGDDCAPILTETPGATPTETLTVTGTSSPAASATATPSATSSPTATASPTATSNPWTWRAWLPWVTR